MDRNDAPAILHLPYNVGNQAWTLSRAERDLGFASDTMEFVDSPQRYPRDIGLALDRRGRLGNLAARLAFLARAVRRYDAFHFYFSDTFFASRLDLPLLAALGKRLVFTFQGCDARLGNTRASRMCDVCPRRDADCRGPGGAAKLRKIAWIRRYADRIFCLNPDLLEVVPGASFLPYAAAPPADLPPFDYRPPQDPASAPAERTLRIFHAPTDRALKGTGWLIAAVERLRAEGLPVELDLAERLPHREVFARAARCHLAADQFLSGWYGGFAVEMMHFGLPVLGWVDPVQSRSVGLPEVPLLSAPPERIDAALRSALERPARLAELSARGRDYARRVHDPRRVALQVVPAYRRSGVRR